MKNLDNLIETIHNLISEIETYEANNPSTIRWGDPNWEDEMRREMEKFQLHFEQSFDMLTDIFLEQIKYFTKENVALIQSIINTCGYLNFLEIYPLTVENFESALFIFILIGDDYRESLRNIDDYLDFAEKNEIDYRNIAKKIIPYFDDIKCPVFREFLYYFNEIMEYREPQQ